MKSDNKGVSTCQPGEEKYETFETQGKKKTAMYQYEYRDEDGSLFTCIAASLTDARTRRDQWKTKKLSDARRDHVRDFLRKINARTIREASWDIHGGKTIVSFIQANGKSFMMMEMIENDICTYVEMFVSAHDGNDFDAMFKAIESYCSGSTLADDTLTELIKIVNDPTHGDLVWRLAVKEKAQKILDTL